MHYVLLRFYLLTLLFAALSGLRQFRLLDKAGKLFSIIICVTILDELCSFYATQKYQNNIPVYNIFSVIEFILIALYFNYSIDTFKKWRIGIILAATGGLLGIVDIRYQTINHIDSYFLLFEGISVITMSLYSIARLVDKYDDIDLRYFPHFWICVLLTFFWALTFLTFGLYDYLQDGAAGRWINTHIQLPANIITYVGIGIVFYLFPKMSKSHER